MVDLVRVLAAVVRAVEERVVRERLVFQHLGGDRSINNYDALNSLH